MQRNVKVVKYILLNIFLIKIIYYIYINYINIMSNNENEGYYYSENEYQNNQNINNQNNNEEIVNTPIYVAQTISTIEENISFYNEQKKILKNLYKNLLNKNKNIGNIETSKLTLKENIEKKHGPIERPRGKLIYNKEVQLKNNSIAILKKEQKNIINSITNIIETNNLNIVLRKNNINTNSLKIKSNNVVLRLKELTDILNAKIKKINDKITQINTILHNNRLNKNAIDKTSISMIYELEEIAKDIIGKNNLSSIFFQNTTLLISNIKEKYTKSKEYKDFNKKYNIYIDLLTDNKDLILDTLNKSLHERDIYRIKIEELINDATFLLYNNNQSENKLNRLRTIMNKINRIKDYKCIELKDSILDTIHGLTMQLP